MTNDSLIYLRHILISIKEIEDDVRGYSQNRFLASRKTQKSVIRGLEIIGEATKNLPKEFTEKYPEIPWQKMAKLRDVLIHQYFRVDLDITWQVVKESLPEIEEKIGKIISSLS